MLERYGGEGCYKEGRCTQRIEHLQYVERVSQIRIRTNIITARAITAAE